MAKKFGAPQVGQWSSPAAEQRFRSEEDRIWREECAVLPEALDIETSVGTTRVYRWPGRGTPVVLLHGLGGTAVQWARMIEGLDDHDIYGVDTMGEVGQSVHRVAFRDAAHLAEWLNETVAGLGLDRVHLVGNSYGSFLALMQAVHRPERVQTITLLDPVGFVEVTARFLAFAAKVYLTALLPARLRHRLANRIGMPILEDRRLVKLGFQAQRHHPFRLPNPRGVTDEELRRVAVPTLVLMGSMSAEYDPRSVAQRLRLNIPDVEVQIIPGTAHALPMDPKADAGLRVRVFVDSRA